MYVPEDLVHAYKRHIIPNANLLTPNQFELQLLTGRTISTLSEGVAACQLLHEQGVQTVVRFGPLDEPHNVRFILFVVCGLPYLAGLTWLPPAGCDQPRY
jgi:hydroxymethylpyrimidine/phosphomethylpyrimidine kinase